MKYLQEQEAAGRLGALGLGLAKKSHRCVVLSVLPLGNYSGESNQISYFC